MNKLKSFDFEEITFENTEMNTISDTEYLGYIICNSEEVPFEQVINFLIEKKDYSFIWFFSEKKISKQEKYILMTLEVNIIITGQPELDMLAYSVKNGITYINSFKKNEELKNEKIYLDDFSRSLIINDLIIELTNMEYLLMSKLMEYKEEVVSYEDLMKLLTNKSSENRKFRVSNIIFHLNQKLKDNLYVKIKNISSMGYKVLLDCK